ncbi:ROK family transcriptional regulator [Gracilibacillus sp. D59]|uniref:ROK family transcriptional regulator n=1 Tax=Gracilibacillus sp. D59 TaxID=3457434 RepID=UPI003FCD496F
MSNLKTGSFEGMKLINKSTILNMIRLEGPISRADIAKKTELAPPTVSSIVSELIEEHMVIEKVGEAKTQGGRKPLMLSINVNAAYVIGIYAAAEVVEAIITTLDGNIVTSYMKTIQNIRSKNEYITIILESIEKVVAKSSVDKQAISGIGVAMHGLVDADNGKVIFSPHLNLENISLKEEIEKVYPVSVFIENDVRTLTLAESWYGEGKDVSDFTCISIGLGIGSGIFINNQIYSGLFHGAGEIGHTIVDLNGSKCRCGNFGCLETFASEAAILNKVKKSIRLGKSTVINDWLHEEDELTFEMVLKAAEEDDSITKEALEEAGRYLGIAIANLNNLLTPSKVILEGRVFSAGDVVLNPLKDMVKNSSLKKTNHNEIVLSKLGKKGMAVGAVTLVLRELFEQH